MKDQAAPGQFDFPGEDDMRPMTGHKNKFPLF